MFAPLSYELSERTEKETLKILIDQLHGWSTWLSQTDSIPREAAPFRSNELESQRQNLSTHSGKKIWHYQTSFSSLTFPFCAVLNALPTDLANAQTASYHHFKKVAGPFSGLAI